MKKFVGLFLLFLISTTFAAAPIVNLHDPVTQQQYTDVTGQTKSPSSPANAQVNLLNRISQLQRSVQRLQGIIEVQQHELTSLKKQQLVLYSDLDKRLTALGAKSDTGTAQRGGETSSLQTINRISVSDANNSKMNKSHGIAVTPTPAVASSTTTVARFDEEQAYNNAYQLVKQKRYSNAIFAMQQFLKDYPESRYVPNAYYWLGELYSVQGENKKAKAAFETVIEQYPDNPKAAGALLKVGYINIANQDYEAARLVFQQVKERYPDTREANLANAKSNALLQQGFV